MMKIDTVLTPDNAAIPYFSFGSGKRPFVILPGIDVKSIISAAKSVKRSYRCFAADYTVYVFDRRQNLPPVYSIRDMAKDTADAMRALKIADAAVFGASQGGMIAQYLMIDAPELVGAAVLGSTAACCSGAMRATVDKWIDLAQKGDIVGLTADFVDRLYSEKTISRFRNFFLHMNDDVTREGLDRFIILAEAILNFDCREELRTVRCPAYVIGAENDLAVGAEASRELAAILGCECYLYGRDYGHCVFDEAQDYRERLLRFFNTNTNL